MCECKQDITSIFTVSFVRFNIAEIRANNLQTWKNVQNCHKNELNIKHDVTIKAKQNKSFENNNKTKVRNRKSKCVSIEIVHV